MKSKLFESTLSKVSLGTLVIFISIILIISVISLFSSKFPDRFPDRPYHWSLPPDIFVCSETNIGIDQMYEARQWWEERGYEFGITIENFPCVEPDGKSFSDLYIPGTIIIYLSDSWEVEKGTVYGYTHRRFLTDGSGEMNAAIIEITDPENQQVLIHELGHAMGWDHAAKEGHIMHEAYSLSGWDDEGIPL